MVMYVIAGIAMIFVGAMMITQVVSVSMLTSRVVLLRQSNMSIDNVNNGNNVNNSSNISVRVVQDRINHSTTNSLSSSSSIFTIAKNRHNRTNTTQQELKVVTVPKQQGNFFTSHPTTRAGRVSTHTNSSKLYMAISFVNGIYHSEDEVNELSDYLKQQFKGEVRPFYNPSSGSWVKDATKAGFELISQSNDLLLAKQLAEHLRNILNDLRPKGRVLHIAHSGGAILTYLAGKYHLTYAESSRIDVVTLGGGRSLTHKYFKGRILNYYARNDPVLILEKRASYLMKVVAAMKTNDSYDTIRDDKHNTTFVFIQPIAKDPLMDHSMYGPTYRLALSWEAVEYRKRLQYMMLLAAREKDIIRLIRKQVANLTGYHHFWMRDNYYWPHQIITPHVNFALTGRWIRKYAANITNIHGLFSGKHHHYYSSSISNETTGGVLLWLNLTTYINGVFKSYGYHQSTDANGSNILLGSSSIADGIRWFFSNSRRNQSGLAVEANSSLFLSSSTGSNDTSSSDERIGMLLSTGGDDRNQTEANAINIYSESNMTAGMNIIPGGDSMVGMSLESNIMTYNNISSSNTLDSFNSSQLMNSTISRNNWFGSLNGYYYNTDSSYYSYNSLINSLNEVSSRVVSYCTGTIINCNNNHHSNNSKNNHYKGNNNNQQEL